MLLFLPEGRLQLFVKEKTETESTHPIVEALITAHVTPIPCLGPSIYDVHTTEGGKVVSGNACKVREASKGRVA